MSDKQPCGCDYSKWIICNEHFKAFIANTIERNKHILRTCELRVSLTPLEYGELQQENSRLRAALIGLVGSNDPKELAEMKAALDLLPIPQEERQKTVSAIDALLGQELKGGGE